MSAGKKFRNAVAQHEPLQVVGTINAYTALMATQIGFQAIYLSGAGVANASYGLPDLGMTNLSDVATDVSRITAVTDVPLLVDADTGWGHAFNIARTIKTLIKAGAAGCHFEDQVNAKRCGHRPGKAIVPVEEMQARIKAAVDARVDEDFVIMARTDAFANEGLQGAIDRANAYKAAGADIIFAEALSALADYQAFASQVELPILANITEFGKTPLFTRDELNEVGVSLILYPLSAMRAMHQAALNVYQTILQDGTQKACLSDMQTRDALYETLNYHAYEQALDKLS